MWICPEDQLDCVCELVEQDTNTNHYVCRYQTTSPPEDESAPLVEDDPKGGGPTASDIPYGCSNAGSGKASVIEGKFALNLP